MRKIIATLIFPALFLSTTIGIGADGQTAGALPTNQHAQLKQQSNPQCTQSCEAAKNACLTQCQGDPQCPQRCTQQMGICVVRCRY